MSTKLLDNPAVQEAIKRFIARAFPQTPGGTRQEATRLQDDLRRVLRGAQISSMPRSRLLATIRVGVGVAEELVESEPAQARSILQAVGEALDHHYARIKFLEEFQYRVD